MRPSVKIVHLRPTEQNPFAICAGILPLLLAALLLLISAAQLSAADGPEPGPTTLPDAPASQHTQPENAPPTPENLQGCGGAQFSSSDAAFEEEVVRLINVTRIDNGLLPLKRVDGLNDAARFHATDMSEESYFSHTSHDRVDGQLVESCQWSDRLRTYYTQWNLIAENIAAGFSSPQKVVNAWMDSPGHRHNILSSNNWETGVGYFNGGGTYRHYWVQDFGRRHNVYPAIINGEAPTTDDGKLTIHIYGEWDEVRLRIAGGEWSGWQTFSASIDWELKARAGTHTVELEMRSATANASASDDIHLTQDTIQPELNPQPDELTFVYDPEQGAVTPGFHTIQPLAAATEPGYTWQIAVDASWLSASPGAGSGTEVVALVPSVSGAGGESEEPANVTVSLLAEDGSVIAQETIVVVIAPASENFAVFVPVVKRK